ncbi:hypothetical protein NQ117_22365 [Paenibacillus sp. SC116]|uniref:hypothetical protein n=1 Tax=Paenibacillus sp. SC116 TaxID=2968986 RepID=UPI00215B63F0|nr:hypothetical protein [Paenibacillus sp. SC116]MCR8846434.1 hypothetical protein [Paenibacillus sp. SC116]
MNKLVILLITAATILTACSNQRDISNNAEENQQSVQTEAVEENKQLAEESTNHDEWSSLPEYDTIIQNIEKKDYTIKTVTDNERERVLLLTNQEGKEQYKTIFIKNTNRFKMINMDGEGLIFNDILESK